MDCLSKIFFLHLFSLRQYYILRKSNGEKRRQLIPTNLIYDTTFIQINFENQLQKYKINDQQIPILKIICKSFKYQLIILLLGCFFQIFFKSLNSIMILFLIQSCQLKNINQSYIFCSIIICTSLLVVTIQSNWYLKARYLYTDVQSIITLVCYKSIIKLKQNTINKYQIGKIINLISSDFNNVEENYLYIIYLLISPFALIISACILVYSLGWLGLITMIIPMINTYFQGLISQRNAKRLENINQQKDKRISDTRRVIEGIRYAKLYNYQMIYSKKIKDHRQNQQFHYRISFFYESLQRALTFTSTYMSFLITLIIIYYFDKSKLTISTIFCSLSVVIFVRTYLWFIQEGLRNLLELNIILQRFLSIYIIKQANYQIVGQISQKNNNDLLNNNIVTHQKQFSSRQLSNFLQIGQIKFTNYSSKWTQDGFQLKNINLFIKPGKIYGVGGAVGSGKSSLLSAILQQMPITKGKCQYKGKIAYVQQQCHLFTGSIKQNILFGMKWNQKLYARILRQSCLVQDLKNLTDGDQTKVGERGVTLSGGQKIRISLARALYSQADIYLLDDPLSALDVKTNNYIFENVLKNMKNKTIILLTHHLTYLQKCDKILILKRGELIITKNQKQIQQINVLNKKQDKKQQEILQNNLKIKENSIFENFEVTFQTFWTFITFSKRFLIIAIAVILYIITEGIMAVFLRLLSNFNNINTSESSFLNYKNLWIILAALIIVYFILVIVRNFMLYQLSISSVTNIHHNMIQAAMRSPLKFYDITSSSMLLNKFSNDISVMDTSLIFTSINLFEGIVIILVAFINITQIMPYFVIPCFTFFVIEIIWFVYWKDAVIQSQNQLLQCKTPIYNQLLFLTQNLTQIHIYQQEQNAKKRMSSVINTYIIQKNSSVSSLATFRIYLYYFAVLLTTSTLFMGLKKINQAGEYAVCVIILIEIQDLIDLYGYMLLNLRKYCVSIARCLSISELVPQADLRTQYDENIGFKEQIQQQKLGIIRKNNNWPQHSIIQYKNFTMRYQTDLQPALKYINLKIEEGTKVAFIGRTGSGKSSMIQSLFRMYESDYESQLFIGGYNAKLMGLRSLRSNMSIIPQTSFIFRGTIRENIDPFNEYSDEKVWKSLEECKLKQYIEELKQKINTLIDNDLEVFSVGQKQLICLARVLIKNNKIVVLDEATSNIDLETQYFVHEVLKKKFKNKTIITIAHRLETIADYDRVIVMQKGKIIEEGNLFKLLVIKESDQQITANGTFAEMVKSTKSIGEKIFSIAKSKYLSQKKKIQ